jgi:hypothetical protein
MGLCVEFSTAITLVQLQHCLDKFDKAHTYTHKQVYPVSILSVICQFYVCLFLSTGMTNISLWVIFD